MGYIKGKIRTVIYESNTGYKVGLFHVKETDMDDLNDLINKTITFTGYFTNLNSDDSYTFHGEYISHERYGYQFSVKSFERLEPVGKDAVVEFLSSSLIKGCSEKTALKIVNKLGEDALNKIKENQNNLLLVPGINEKKAAKIYESIIKYSETDDLIVYLKGLGFNTPDTLTLINTYGSDIKVIVATDIYSLIDLIDFKKLDIIYLKFGKNNSDIRIKACLLQGMKSLGMNKGDTYHYLDEIYAILVKEFNINLEKEEFLVYLKNLLAEGKIVNEEEKFYLREYYEMEEDIAANLNAINHQIKIKVANFKDKLSSLEIRQKMKYNKDQKTAIKKALENPITVITGGPGTGKTTIIKAIVDLYINEYNLSNIEILKSIALLAPTGRASRRMSEATNLPAMTIHRYLKWNKDTNEFMINETNKNYHKLIIIDETSMIDTNLFDSLLKGLNSNIKLILIGDSNQLPSVAPGMILDDIIKSEKFVFCPLEKIYRQSKNSYIPYLCKEIKDHNLSDEYENQKDDYNFLSVSNELIKNAIEKICQMSIAKGLSTNDLQVLVPMYKGENGIDNLNIILQNLFNPSTKEKKEFKLGDIIFREGDKVLQLVNDPDNNVFNGDIGYIRKIEKKSEKNKEIVIIDFDANQVMYKREDMYNIKHAYAISIHKSQGSEFNHVIIPVTNQYFKMLYNKLIYTGISRAKKGLVLIGSKKAFLASVANDYSETRKTGLKAKLMNI